MVQTRGSITLAGTKIFQKHKKLIDNALASIIDQWYLSVSDYYITSERRVEDPSITIPEELKRFHDESGHRIKFNKGGLDFTYGLSVELDGGECLLEVSVNNKVSEFDYDELVHRLALHYDGVREDRAGEGTKLDGVRNCDIFDLNSTQDNSITVEERQGKADIVRVAFRVRGEHVDGIVADAPALVDAIQQYCVAPLRRIYAEIYRTRSR